MKSIWAVTRTMMIEVFRMKGLQLFLAIFTLAYTVGFAYWLQSTGGFVNEKVQTFISYSLATLMTILSFLTIFISIYSISRDLKNKDIYSITTKPISRGGYMFGKMFAMVLLNCFWLTISSVLIYAISIGLGEYGSFKASKGFIKTNEIDSDNLRQFVYVARQSVTPDKVDNYAEALASVNKVLEEKIKVEKIKDGDQISKLRNRMLVNKMMQLDKKGVSVDQGRHYLWHFKNINMPDKENGVVTIRYRMDTSSNPTDLKMNGLWLVGPEDPIVNGGMQMKSFDKIRTAHEFSVSADAVSASGELFVAFKNPIENGAISVIFPRHNGFEILYSVDSYEANFVRAILVVLIRLMFLSILGVALGGWLSFPVAALFAIVLYILSLSHGFIDEAMSGALSGYLYLIPDFSHYDSIIDLEKGRIVRWEFVAKAFFSLVVIKGGITYLIGYVIFKFRELARVIV